MARFSERMVTEVVRQFWAAMARGEFITDAAAEAGTYRVKGARWLRAEGGVRPRRGRDLKGRCLTFSEREEIAVARAGGESIRAIVRRLGRCPSTISRELARNAGAGGGGGYRATTAHALAYERASRPKPAKLATNVVLRKKVEQDLRRRYSPEQIVGRLRHEFPHDQEMWVSAETIYQSLYVQSRGALRRDLTGVCGPAGRCAAHAAKRVSARTGSRT
jgi:IS30 family transposase